MSQEYNVLRGNSIVGLAELVNIYFDEGWQCQGGVFVVTKDSTNFENQTDITFYQAVVRETKETKPKGGISF